MEFQEWVEDQVARRFKTATALASAIGMQLSPFVRGVQTGTFNVQNILRLAEVTDEDPSRLLHIAGKGDVAQMIERLYGSGKDSLKASERDVLQLWSNMPTKSQRHVRELMTLLSEPVGGAAPDKATGSGRAPKRVRR